MLTVYLKATNYCNVGCSHCYLTQEVRAEKEKMSDETFMKVAQMLEELRVKQRKDQVHIIWHGGEPLVLKAKYYQNAQKILQEKIKKVTFSLQTSLIPLTEDHLSWIKNDLQGWVGSSMDFSARQIAGSPDKYQDLWMKKVNMCRDHGIRVIPGVTPSKQDMKKTKQMVQWMVDRGFERFNIERYNTYGFKTLDAPNNQDHALFLIELFDDVMQRMKDNQVAPWIRVLGAAIQGVLWQQPGDRWGGSCQSDFLVIEPNGNLNNCPDKTSKDEAYSNINDGVDAWLSSPQRRKWIRIQAIEHREDHCKSCENNQWCKSGCPITCNDLKKEKECSGYKSFISHVRNYIETSIENEQMVLMYLKKKEFGESEIEIPDIEG